jgi:cytochrome c-type biogenesis protein CcmH/NrfG
MAIEPNTAPIASQTLRATQVYSMAALCLVVGLAAGYLFRGSPSSLPPAQPAAKAAPPTAHTVMPGGGHMPSLDEMKQMADTQAAPLLEKLKSDPNNGALLGQVGAIYHTTHQFKQAAAYYGRAAQADPRNVAMRTRLASSLYRSGDVDGAIAQLNQALRYDPKDANSLFDLGMIRLHGKQDGKGALAAWQQLLKSNPQLSADRKAMVQKMMADVLTTQGDQHGIEGVRSNDRRKSDSH